MPLLKTNYMKLLRHPTWLWVLYKKSTCQIIGLLFLAVTFFILFIRPDLFLYMFATLFFYIAFNGLMNLITGIWWCPGIGPKPYFSPRVIRIWGVLLLILGLISMSLCVYVLMLA